MIRVNVVCPICKKKGHIEISEESIKKCLRGILAVNVTEKTICKDSFVTYLDKNLNVRDYFVVDFQLELPDAIFEKIEKIDEEKKFLIDKVLNLDLIKLNLSATILAFTLKVIFLGKKILLIIEEQLQFLQEHLNNFYGYITKNSFKLNLNIISKKDYNENKNNYKDYLVFDNKDIINDINKILNPKTIAVERRIIQKFLAESDQNLSLLMLKNEIQKAFELSNFILEHLNKIDTKKKIDITEIHKELQKHFQVSISPMYLIFLLEIVENYYKVELPGSLKRTLKIVF